MTTAKIPLVAVLGDPIAHSKSPRIHNHWLRQTGITGYYIPIHVAPSDFVDVIRTLPRLGFVGANVTIPHKEAAIEIADDMSTTARQIGAGNTLLFREDGSIYLDNTDSYGFLQNLRENVPEWNPEKCHAVVLGAGGASRAVLHALISAGAPKITLANRTQAKAENLAHIFGPGVTTVGWSDVSNLLATSDLLVNTTSLGMVGQQPLDLNLDQLKPTAIVSDLVYNPLITGLLQTAQTKGCRIVDGLGMLLHQAVPGFEMWFGHKPIVDNTLREIVLST